MLTAAYCADAWAADGDGNVLSRQRPQNTPRGIALGAMRLYPRLQQQVLFDDNVFGSESGLRSGFVFDTAPQITVGSDWSRHAAGLVARANVGRNPSFPSENYLDWEVAGNGRLDLGRGRLTLSASHERDHVNRSAPNEERGVEPTKFSEQQAQLRYQVPLGRNDLGLHGRLRVLDFDDVPAVRNDRIFVLNQDDRDRLDFTVGARLRYRTSANIAWFIAPEAGLRDYAEAQDFNFADRSSEGYELVVGAELELPGYARGEIRVGYRLQDYAAPYADISTPLFGVDAQWDLSALTSITLNAERRARETQGSTFSGFVSTRTSLRVDHELLRNVLLNAGFSRWTDDYEGVADAARDDVTYDIRASVTYLLSSYIHILLDYHYLKRNTTSDVSTTNISGSVRKNLAIVQIRLQF